MKTDTGNRERGWRTAVGSWKDSSSEGLASNSIIGLGYELDSDSKSDRMGMTDLGS